jgi:REP element-mobilizing transposase RayT
MSFVRKRIRLSRERYLGRGLFFLTFCTQHRVPFFTSEKSAMWLVGQLHEHARTCNFRLHAWCVMPDHLHLLTAGLLDTSDLLSFTASFKRATGFEGRRRFGKQLWQTHFYDHIVRQHESPERIAGYIWWNPVRRGLCGKAQDYPFSGSDTIDWRRTFLTAPDWTPPWKKSS